MDRARPADALRTRARRRILIVAAALTSSGIGALGCDRITGDFDRVIALEIVGPLIHTLEEGDSLQLAATALSARGEAVADVAIVWAILDTNVVAFTVDSATGWVRATQPGEGRVQARIESLRTEAITITVTAAPDSLARQGGDTVVVQPNATTSGPMTVAAFDLTTTPGTETPVPGVTVRFTVTTPAAGDPSLAGFSLSTPDAAVHDDPHDIGTSTDAAGMATATLTVPAGGTGPDPLVVTARGFTAGGTEISGSGIRFFVTLPPPPLTNPLRP